MACGREYQKNIKQPVRVVGVSLTIPKYKSGALKGMEHNTEEDPSDPMGVYGGGVGGGVFEDGRHFRDLSLIDWYAPLLGV